MSFLGYTLRPAGYFKDSDESGPYWIDDDGTPTLMVSRHGLAGIATDPNYVVYGNIGWIHKTTGAGPFAAIN